MQVSTYRGHMSAGRVCSTVHLLLSKFLYFVAFSSHVSPPSPRVFAHALDSFSSPPVSPTLLSSPLLSLAACLACDGPEAAMLSSPLNLLFPFSQAPTPLHSAHSSSSSRSPSILLRRHPRLHALLLLLLLSALTPFSCPT